MNVLLVSPFLPYPGVPHGSGKLMYLLLKVLARRHSVHLLSRCFPGEERNLPLLKEMLAGVEIVPTAGPAVTGDPLTVLRTAWSYYCLATRAHDLLSRNRFDICQVESTEAGVFYRGADRVPSVLSCHDILAKPAFRRFSESRGARRIAAWGSWKATKAAEKRSVSKFARVFTLSEEDRDWAERLYPGVPVRVLHYPGGIDYEGLPRREDPNRILFLAALNRPANVDAIRWFFRRAWPAVRIEAPEARLLVAGAGMSETLREELAADQRVTVAGYVERVEDLYKSSSVFIAPILVGGGIIVKILDAMAAGTPVVTTSYGNEGIRAKAGEQILVADDPGQFARSVIRLLRDADDRKRVREAGQAHVERRFSADLVSSTIEETYREVTGRT